MLYMCSQGEWGVGVFACVCLSACSQANIKTLSRNDLCVCLYVCVAVTEIERRSEREHMDACEREKTQNIYLCQLIETSKNRV